MDRFINYYKLNTLARQAPNYKLIKNYFAAVYRYIAA